jgi:hypothetical protein
MAKRDRYTIFSDGLTLRPRFSRRYAVVAERDLKFLEETTGVDYESLAALQTDCPKRAREYCDELNAA